MALFTYDRRAAPNLVAAKIRANVGADLSVWYLDDEQLAKVSTLPIVP
ncbi:hypothetical protein ACLB1S_05980 [Escherichia coli]